MEARLFVTTGTPVQPHSSEGLEGLSIEFRWVPVPPAIFEHVGLVADANTLAGFCDQFSIDMPEDLCRSLHTAVRCAIMYICVCMIATCRMHSMFIHTDVHTM